MRDQATRLEKMTRDTSGQSRSNETEDITTLNSRERGAKALRRRDIANFIAYFSNYGSHRTTAEHADLLSCGNLRETVGDFNDELTKNYNVQVCLMRSQFKLMTKDRIPKNNIYPSTVQ